MKQTTKPTRAEVAKVLREALMPFCEDYKDLRPDLAEPFRQQDGDGRDCICATDGHVLIRIRSKEAGGSIGGFPKRDKPCVHNVIPAVGFDDLLAAMTLRRDDVAKVVSDMKAYEDSERQPAIADLQGVWMSMEGLSHIETAMRICGAEAARLVWHKDELVLLQLLNEKDQEAVTILHMGLTDNKDGHKMFTVPAAEGCDEQAVRIDWQRGIREWADIKAEQQRQEEAERMARREVYMVEVVKRAYIPVYAKDADEARRLCDSESWFDPEDNGDDEWMLGNEVPEAEDVDDLEDCYEHVLTRDGVVHRDEIYDLERISDEWHAEHDNKDKED